MARAFYCEGKKSIEQRYQCCRSPPRWNENAKASYILRSLSSSWIWVLFQYWTKWKWLLRSWKSWHRPMYVSIYYILQRTFPDFQAKPDCSCFSHKTNKVDFLVRPTSRARKWLKAGLLIAMRKCQPASREGDRGIKNQVEDRVKHRSPEPGWDYVLNRATNISSSTKSLKGICSFSAGELSWCSAIPRHQ